MKKRRGNNLGLIFAMLGLGLVLALIFPSKFLVVILSIALIVSGIVLCKTCCWGGCRYESGCGKKSEDVEWVIAYDIRHQERPERLKHQNIKGAVFFTAPCVYKRDGIAEIRRAEALLPAAQYCQTVGKALAAVRKVDQIRFFTIKTSAILRIQRRKAYANPHAGKGLQNRPSVRQAGRNA